MHIKLKLINRLRPASDRDILVMEGFIKDSRLLNDPCEDWLMINRAIQEIKKLRRKGDIK